MSGHWRVCVAAFLFMAGLLISPAFSNPLTDLLNPAPKEATPPVQEATPAVPARVACLQQPGATTARGQHWFYRFEGHRRCWFQAAESHVSVSKPSHRYAGRPSVTEGNEAVLRKKTFADARAQMLSTGPADAFRLATSAPEVADKASAPVEGTAPVPAAPVAAQPVAAQPAIDQPMPDRASTRPADVEMLLAASSLATDMAAAASSTAASAPSVPAAGEDRWDLMVGRVGSVLIVLGLIFLLGSLLASRLLDSGVLPIRRA